MKDKRKEEGKNRGGRWERTVDYSVTILESEICFTTHEADMQPQKEVFIL